MKIPHILTTITAIGALLAVPTAMADSSVATKTATATATKSIVELAVANESFTTLVAAVKAADLAETLSGECPFTVFAPSNEAFAYLPDGTVESLLKPENKQKLQKILTLHVVSGKVMATDVKPGSVKTLNGESINVAVADGGVTVNGAKVVKTDIVGSNGVIHMPDSVILPGF